MNDPSTKESSDNAKEQHAEKIAPIKVMLYGISAASFAVILALVSIDELDWPFRLALGCFSITMPLSMVLVLTVQASRHFDELDDNDNFVTLGLACQNIFFAGLACLLWHFSWIYAAILIVVTIASLLLIADEPG